MNKTAIRVGIDVGGTHTKAVALDNDTYEILGKASVKTTHDHPMGVSHGIIQVFERCLTDNNLSADQVVFIAHSTTQATNALLEGDVATVGVLGMGKGFFEKRIAKKQTNIKDIPLVTGRYIQVKNVFCDAKQFNREVAAQAIDELTAKGCNVIVASMAFGVDNMDEETMVSEVAAEKNVPVTMASDITKLYGLATRTHTAAINASILPKMLTTAQSIESSIREAGIKVPLMIMRGDGGVMDVAEMKKRPVLSMLSGPAASVVGALMYLRASNGIYFEVGGTSTNIGVIKNGRPAVKYAVLGGHRTYISSLDVRVLGVAGGSMVRVQNNKIIDVGPRSAHIAGLPYVAFTPAEEIEEPVVEYVAPREKDTQDYVVIRCKNGQRYALTNTCAANVLGYAKEGVFAHGNVESCRKGMAALAKVLGKSVEETARNILEVSCGKIIPLIKELAEEYSLDQDQMLLVGCGGGAGALLPFAAESMALEYSIPEQAEVISSIGVALAMVREVVERHCPDPTRENILAIRKEAIQRVINSGAVEDSVEVHIEIDAQTQKVTAIALGSTEVQTTDLLKSISEEEGRDLAAKSLNVTRDKVRTEDVTDGLYIYTTESEKNDNTRRVRVIDKKGFIKVQRSGAVAASGAVRDFHSLIERVWNASLTYSSDLILTPDIYMCIGGRVIDCSGVISKEQAMNILETELLFMEENDKVVMLGIRNSIWR